MRLTDAHQFDDREGNWVRVLNFDYREHGPLPAHFTAALWRWYAARNRRGLARIDAFGRDLSDLNGIAGKWHLFNLEAPQTSGYFLELGRAEDTDGPVSGQGSRPFSGWPFPAQVRAHGLSLTGLRQSGDPQLSVITRQYGRQALTYMRLLCPLSRNGRDISHAAALIEPDDAVAALGPD